MKTLKNVLLSIVLALMGAIAVPFIFAEFRNFFSLEFINMNNPVINGLAYLLRGLYFLLILTLSVFTILFITKKKKFCIILFAVSASLFIGALLSLIFFEYYVSLVIIFITLVQLIIISIGFFKKENSACLIAKE